ncbi:YSIRK-type signal peptide-containing protein [Staphylococcus gallinarum]|nr:YSIRK-type signal peptide-containing protein [Staphylococcus gallinarum]RIO82487.1 YSIRK-type signal peptide-containing protein [Staphylococcus gallinarum]
MNKNCNNISSQRNKYSIRKLTVGTASLLIGATLVFGLGNEAYADELASQEKTTQLLIQTKIPNHMNNKRAQR